MIYLRNLRNPLLQISTMKQKAEYERRERQYGKEGIENLPKPSPIVPIDFVLSSKTRSVVITGPNTGGKTVAMSGLGLCVLMAKCGLGIPASNPVILPFFSNVLADIGDE